MTTIIGIDFSGARQDRNTWVARGVLSENGTFEIYGVARTPRQEVFELLSTVSTPAVAGIDFPFGVPRAFADFLSVGTLKSMPDFWRVVADLSLEDFVSARDAFVDRFGEPKREGDATNFPESYSPLHKVNPNMVPMTYYGIGMLNELHEGQPGRWDVPPLNSTGSKADQSVTLLETMPGAFLKAIGTIYKGYKKPRSMLQRDERRNTIMDALQRKSGVAPCNLDMVRDECLANDDCLDAVVASVAAASWAQDNAKFRHPDEDELPAAGLEGWIYVPQSAE